MFGGPGAFRIGEIDGTTTPRIVALQQAFVGGAAGRGDRQHLRIPLVEDRARRDLFRHRDDRFRRDRSLRRARATATLFGRLAGEVVAVADASGVRLETFDGFDPTVFRPGATPDTAAIAATWDGQNRYWNSHESKRTGVWRDLAIHKRKTEVDRLIGPVIEIGRERGVATPGLSRLVAVVKEIEERRTRRSVCTISLRSRMADRVRVKRSGKTMQYARLGATNLKVSRLALGAMGIGHPSWREWVLDEDGSRPIVKRALDLGINFIDTCDYYSDGQSELVLGRLLE